MSDKTKFTPEFIAQLRLIASKANRTNEFSWEFLAAGLKTKPNNAKYLAAAGTNFMDALDEILRLRRALVAVIVLTCNADNQPHQYVGDPDGLMKAAMDGDFVGEEVIDFMKGQAEK